jgi:hypothetical protein
MFFQSKLFSEEEDVTVQRRAKILEKRENQTSRVQPPRDAKKTKITK